MKALLMETGKGTFLRKKLLGFYEVAPEDLAAPCSRRHVQAAARRYLCSQQCLDPSYSISSQPLTLPVLGH